MESNVSLLWESIHLNFLVDFSHYILRHLAFNFVSVIITAAAGGLLTLIQYNTVYHYNLAQTLDSFFYTRKVSLIFVCLLIAWQVRKAEQSNIYNTQ